MNEKINKPLLEIEIKDFITKIKTSESRNALYYEKEGKHKVPVTKEKHISPKGNCKYEWKNHKTSTKTKIILYDIATNKPLIKNPKTVGTPKYIQIKGNTIYAGIGGFINRMIIINGIKNNFRPNFINKTPIKQFPIHLEFIMYNELNLKNQLKKGKTKSQDLDNVFNLYIKASQDLMKNVGLIPDDDLRYIRSTSYKFIDSKEKKLIINVYKFQN
jgi:Holliday junction resolvase RusA-like endonuclease